MKHHDHDEFVPKQHGPIVESMNLRKLHELVIEHTRVLTSNWFIWESGELARWRFIRRNNLKMIRSILWQHLAEIVKIEAANNFPSYPMNSIPVKSLYNPTRWKDKTTRPFLELLTHLIHQATFFACTIFPKDFT
jgi:hypothetical protein